MESDEEGRRGDWTDEQRRRIGRALQRLRGTQNQAPLAQRAGISVGTLQNIEYHKCKVHQARIERYAIALGTTVDHVLHPEIIPPQDPRWRDLNGEHLAIARRYMLAYKAVREAVELLLGEDASVADLLAAVAHRVGRNPGFAPKLREFLDKGSG